MFSKEHIIFFHFEITRNLVKNIFFQCFLFVWQYHSCSDLFLQGQELMTGDILCNEKTSVVNDKLQTYLAIVIDNLYIHELLGYMSCLFFKSVIESFIFFCFFFLLGFYFMATLLCSFNCLQNHLKLCNFDHDFEVRRKFFKELFSSYFKIIITFSLFRTGLPCRSSVHKTKKNKETWDRLAINIFSFCYT